MAQIRSSSAELKAFFQTGDVPTEDQFEDLILSTAIYDGSLPNISGSSSGTGSFSHLLVNSSIGTNLIPSNDNTFDLGSTTFEWRDLFVDRIAYLDTAIITDPKLMTKETKEKLPDCLQADIDARIKKIRKAEWVPQFPDCHRWISKGQYEQFLELRKRQTKSRLNPMLANKASNQPF